MNLETLIDMLSWYKILSLNGFNLIRAKPKLLRKQERAYKSSWSRLSRIDDVSMFGVSMINLHQDLPDSDELSVQITIGITDGIAETAVRRVKK